MYARLKKILKLSFSGDDRITQENLFKLQDELVDLILDVARKEKKEDKLLKDFPWLYQNAGTPAKTN